MLQLIYSPLSNADLTYLADQSKEFANRSRVPGFNANVFWQTRRTTVTFGRIVEHLKSIHPAGHFCAYCEANVANEIEHIKSKAKFPDLCFSFDNYLLICGICNKIKLDQWHVFVNHVSEDKIEYDPSVLSHKTLRPVFINQRSEDPLIYLQLDLITGKWASLNEEDKRSKARAEYTIGLIGLNRELMRTSRRDQLFVFVNYLEVAALRAQVVEGDWDSLDRTIKDQDGKCDRALPFAQERARLIDAVKRAIQRSRHQSTWVALKRYYLYMPWPRTQSYFAALPEALKW